MTGAEAIRPEHPGIETLALYSAGDLSWFGRWRVSSHIAHCGDCEQQVLLFRSATAELKREAATETLTGFEAIADWSQLEREMLGNIAVGVAAARCIENVGTKRAIFSRVALVGGLLALFMAGWMTHIPREQTERLVGTLRTAVGLDHPQPMSTSLKTTPDGIAVRAQGVTLTIRHPPTAVVSLAGASTVAARYVDEDTGQVTITNVYGQ